MPLRDYQVLARDQIRSAFARGVKKVLLKLATGSGKTTIFSEILRLTYQRGNRGAMIVRGRQLVDQASERLMRDHVDHGVMMANHWLRRIHAPVQVCSVDTLKRRGEFPQASLLVLDEADLFANSGGQDFLRNYPNAFVLAVTATPWTRESLRHMADEVIAPISMQELINQGYLVRPRYFAPSIPNLDGVRITAGDYVAEQLQERMSFLTGDIIQTWFQRSENRPTILFAVTIEHSMNLARDFRAAGIPAEHLDADSSREERAAAIRRIYSGQTKVICNVGIFGRGVDIPPASCIVMARPTKSYNLFIQQAGRGTRPMYADGFDLSTIQGRLAAIENSTKRDFLILDHAGNVIRHGFITNEPDVDLDGIKRKNLNTGPKPSMCRICYLIFSGPHCPSCGPQARVEPNEPEILVDETAQLEELTDMPFAAELVQFVNQCKETRKKKGYHHGWVYHQVKDRYGEEIANQLYPDRGRQRRDRDLPPGVVRRTFTAD